MIKKSLVGLGTTFILGMSSFAQAAGDAGPKVPMDAKESRVSSAFLVQLLNSIEKTSIDFETAGSVDSKTGFNPDMMKGKGIVEFGSDWTFPTSSAGKDGSSSSNEIDKIMPTITVDAKDLIGSLTVSRDSNVTDLFLDFYKGYDSTEKKWLKRPLSITANNQLSKEGPGLLKIKVYWVHIKLIQPTDTTKPTIVQGNCYSTKEQPNIINGEKREVEMICEIEGSYSKDDYHINYKYLNKSEDISSLIDSGAKL